MSVQYNYNIAGYTQYLHQPKNSIEGFHTSTPGIEQVIVFSEFVFTVSTHSHISTCTLILLITGTYPCRDNERSVWCWGERWWQAVVAESGRSVWCCEWAAEGSASSELAPSKQNDSPLSWDKNWGHCEWKKREREGEGDREREKSTCVFHQNDVYYTYTVFMALFSSIPSARSSTVSTRFRSSNVLIYSNRDMQLLSAHVSLKTSSKYENGVNNTHILDTIY